MDKTYLLVDNEEMAKSVSGKIEWGCIIINLSKQRQEDNRNHQYQQRRLINTSLVALFIATIGTVTEISGANFDITLHLHRHPGAERLLIDAETFLSPSHTTFIPVLL